MLRVPQGKVPDPAAEVIRQLATQTRGLRARNTHKQVDCVRGTFRSPMASWLPPKSQDCEFFVLKPPAGALALHFLFLHIAVPSASHEFRYRNKRNLVIEIPELFGPGLGT